MPKRTIHPTLLFGGACALGAILFAGGYELRARTDALARVSRVAGTSDESLLVARDQKTPQIPLGDFYSAISDLLKQQYVEPIKDDQKLASGGVRGMILSLGDPRCAFMDKDEFRAFLNAREGRYEGIGVELDYRGSVTKPKAGEPAPDDPRDAVLASRVPYLVATMVVPGGPADRAGVKPGDVVSEIDGHWVPDAAEIARFEKAVAAFRSKKIAFEAVAKLQQELRKKSERSLMPTKAKDRLTLGTSGTVSVIWKRAGAPRTTKITRAESQVTPFGIKDGAIVMRFDTQTPGRLRGEIKDKTTLTLDLRNNVDGDFESMRRVLAVLAPSGTYGSIVTDKKEPASPLTVQNGNARPPKLTIRVDETTRGPAAILARALANRRLATLVGGPTGTDLSVREVVHLPDGTGYTLVTGEYSPTVSDRKVALVEERS